MLRQQALQMNVLLHINYIKYDDMFIVSQSNVFDILNIFIHSFDIFDISNEYIIFDIFIRYIHSHVLLM